MSYSLKRRLADYVCDHPSLNRKAICLYHSLQEVIRLINPPEIEHTKKRKQCTKH